MTWTGPGSHHTPRHVAPGSAGIEEQPQGEQVVAVWARGRRCLQMGGGACVACVLGLPDGEDGRAPHRLGPAIAFLSFQMYKVKLVI